MSGDCPCCGCAVAQDELWEFGYSSIRCVHEPAPAADNGGGQNYSREIEMENSLFGGSK